MPRLLSWLHRTAASIKPADRRLPLRPVPTRLLRWNDVLGRPEALKPLRDLRLSSAIPEEQGLLDGCPGHAIERVFSAAGYRLATATPSKSLTAECLAQRSMKLLRSSPGDLWADRPQQLLCPVLQRPDHHSRPARASLEREAASVGRRHSAPTKADQENLITFSETYLRFGDFGILVRFKIAEPYT
jgi:hypothetical protein